MAAPRPLPQGYERAATQPTPHRLCPSRSCLSALEPWPRWVLRSKLLQFYDSVDGAKSQ